MDDIVERLREWQTDLNRAAGELGAVATGTAGEAADEIRRLRAECESWKREAEHHAALNRGGNDE